jgi:hypothetical protein
MQESAFRIAERFLMVDCMLHLGLANVLFVLQMGTYMARMLNRTLVFSSHLRMRSCLIPSFCENAKCDFRDGRFECPISAFINSHALDHNGVTLVRKEQELLQRLEAFHDLEGFDLFYRSGFTVLDQIQPRPAIGANRNETYVGGQLFQLSLSCESIPMKIKVTEVANQAIDFRERYRFHNEPIVYIHGTPHKIGHSPVSWSTAEALGDSYNQWTSVVKLNSDVDSLGQMLANLILARSTRRSFTCVHLRRGDFSELGWNTNALKLGSVLKAIERARLTQEAVYIATDETNLDKLTPLKAGNDIFFWKDFYGQLLKNATKSMKIPGVLNMLGFQDYVGAVEQRACVSARAFLGSHCSLFSGRIVNMRRESFGDGSLRVIVEET